MAKAKGQEQLQSEADTARRKAVDAKNKKDAKEALAKAEAHAKTPLTNEETAFITRIAPMMNKGRHVEKPSPADITRYAQLVTRANYQIKNGGLAQAEPDSAAGVGPEGGE